MDYLQKTYNLSGHQRCVCVGACVCVRDCCLLVWYTWKPAAVGQQWNQWNQTVCISFYCNFPEIAVMSCKRYRAAHSRQQWSTMSKTCLSSKAMLLGLLLEGPGTRPVVADDNGGEVDVVGLITSFYFWLMLSLRLSRLLFLSFSCSLDSISLSLNCYRLSVSHLLSMLKLYLINSLSNTNI